MRVKERDTTHGPDIREHQFGDKKVDKVERPFSNLGAKVRRRHLAYTEFRKHRNELSENHVHEREERSRPDNANKRDSVQRPPQGVVVRE